MPIETLSLPRIKIVGAAAFAAIPFTGMTMPYLNRNGRIVQQYWGGDTIARVHETSGICTLVPAQRDGLRQGFWLRQKPSDPPEDPGVYAQADLSGCQSMLAWSKSGSLSWCGLFVRWVLESAGISASWVNRQLTLPAGDFKRYEKNGPGWNSLKLEAGDIGIIGGRMHHVILAEEIRAGVFEVAEGNMGRPVFVKYRTGTIASKDNLGVVFKLLD